MTFKTDFNKGDVGRKLGTITIDVFEAQGSIDYAARPVIEYTEALQQMEALLSDTERMIVVALMRELVISSSSLFAYVQNPDKFNKDL